MKLIHTLILIVLTGFVNQLHAQFQPTSNLTVFSEDGYKFYLILNGERQNDVPQTNIRIEELPQPYYNCKIIFEDKTQKEITRNMLMLVDANNVPQDVTYKIKKDRNGKQVLRFFSFIPAQQNMIRPASCAVYRYGNPAQIIAGPGVLIEHRVDNGNRGNGGAGIQMNSGNGSVNITINDPNAGGGNTQWNSNTQNNTYYNEPVADGCYNAFPMNTRDFEAAKRTVEAESFDQTRVDIAKQIASSNCISASQVSMLCKLFSFEESKLDFAKFAYDHCTDPNNYFKVNAVFNFSSSKTELGNYIKGR